jgi:alpha-glucosidase
LQIRRWEILMTTAIEHPSTPNWYKARQKPKNRVLWSRPSDIFSGRSQIESASIEGVRVLRLSVTPQADGNFPHSYAVIDEPTWLVDNSASVLPYAMEWQQSLPARWDFLFNLPEGTKCFGLGERYSGLDLRGGRHTLCATDNPDHDESMDSMYQSIPLMILSSGEDNIGLFLDSPAPQRWHLDSDLNGKGRVELFSRRGWRLYVIGSTSLPSIVRAFTSLTGRASLPPRWALGYFQSRWSYSDEETARQIGKEFRSRKIPCDTIVLDIDYMEDYKVFSISRERFPQLQRLVEDLARDKFKVVTIVDPAVKNDPNYNVFLEGIQNVLFCKTEDGRLFLDNSWCGTSAWPDFLKQETRDWWAENLGFYTDRGVAGIWNDMNEPTILETTLLAGKKPLLDEMEELPSEIDQIFVQTDKDEKIGHLEVRNLYGLLMCQATHEGLLAKAPEKRPFVLSRSAYAGIQRYGATWLGDNKSFFEHMAKSIPMLLNLGLCGVPFSGADVGGFAQDADSDLLVRWFELGIFYPFFRNHSAMDTAAQEPWAHSPTVESHIRNLIETRYRLLPYIQSLFWEHVRTGAPLMRPLMWHYPNDQFAAQVDDQFLFGSDILVAPMLCRGKSHRLVYFPRGLWYPFNGGSPLVGGKAHLVELKLGSVPAFVRDGAIIPLAGIMESTEDYDRVSITFAAFGDSACGVFFEDDGESFAFRDGTFNEWFLRAERGVLKAQEVHGNYQAPKREFYLQHEGITKQVQLPC